MKQYNFTKMSGAGNDFVVFDSKMNPELELSPDFIARICKRHTGIGADGVILISDSDEFPFEMTYYNADGSTGSLCANGARCSLKYANVSGRIGNDKIFFRSNGNIYSGKVFDDGKVEFFLNHPKKMKQNFKIAVRNQLIPASFADTGSPHIIIRIKDVLKNPGDESSFYDDINDFPVAELGREIRYHKDFAPAGVNVNFIKQEEGYIKIRSYERGVEDETLACGTGSVAAALITFVKEGTYPPMKLLPKSGDELTVDFRIMDMKVQDLSLTGPAEVIFEGELSI